MRILIATWTCRQVGGTETYLGRITSLLTAEGHEIGFAYEIDGPSDRPFIALPGRATRFKLSTPDALEAVRRWRPDVVYAHGLLDPDIERQVIDLAPAVFFAHTYYGTCISGDKTHKFPVIQPCARKFGAACLALYYPRRCGGLNPGTLVKDYIRQRERLSLLGRYDAVVTHSEHMRREFVRHGAARGRVFSIPFVTSDADEHRDVPQRTTPRQRAESWQLTFVGRMDRLKGGEHLIDALPRIHEQTRRPLRLVLAGDGPDRRRWEQRAAAIVQRLPSIRIEFAGWLQRPQLASLLDASDLLIMPSLWPEPYGLVGSEANRRGVPVAAYATGGIPEWLIEGENGGLAPADPPTAEGLADAIVRCLTRLAADESLRERARAKALSQSDRAHVAALLEIFREVAHPAAGAGADLAR